MSIVFDRVSFSYEGASGKPVLRNVSLTVRDGEFLGIAGHTGSGKSTLIQHMNGILHPTSGRVVACGIDLSDKKAASALRGRIGVVFQYPEHQLFAATVAQDVAFGPRNLGLPASEVDARVEQALEDVGLDPSRVASMSPFELSGGQQRRVAFAGILAMRPEFIVMDEPAAGLDPQGRSELLGLISSLHAGGLTVVMVSHSMSDLAKRCDRIVVLSEGEVFAQGTPEEVFARGDDLRSIGLDVPPAQRLAAQLRARGINLPHALYDTSSLACDIAARYREFTKAGNGKAAEAESNTLAAFAAPTKYPSGKGL